MNKAKVVFNLALVGAFLGAAFSSVALFKMTAQPKAFLTTSSPKGTYTVHLTGRKERPSLPFVSHEVRFNVTKGAEDFLANKYLHSGDWFDPSFDILYPQHTWVSDNTLHFYRQDYFSEGRPETIVVANQSNKVINYLRITSVDSYLLFGMQPGSTTNLAISAPRGDFRWIGVDGEFSAHQSIKQSEEGFLFTKDRKGPFTYYIYIDEDSSTIESKGLEKYK